MPPQRSHLRKIRSQQTGPGRRVFSLRQPWRALRLGSPLRPHGAPERQKYSHLTLTGETRALGQAGRHGVSSRLDGPALPTGAVCGEQETLGHRPLQGLPQRPGADAVTVPGRAPPCWLPDWTDIVPSSLPLLPESVWEAEASVTPSRRTVAAMASSRIALPRASQRSYTVLRGKVLVR